MDIIQSSLLVLYLMLQANVAIHVICVPILLWTFFLLVGYAFNELLS